MLCSFKLRDFCTQLLSDFQDDDARSLFEFLWTPAGRLLIAGLPNAIVAAAAVFAAAFAGSGGGREVDSSGYCGSVAALDNPVLAHGHTTTPVFAQSVHDMPMANAAASTAHAIASCLGAEAEATTPYRGPTAAQRAANNSCSGMRLGERLMSQNCTVDLTVNVGIDSAYSHGFSSLCVKGGPISSGMDDLRTIGDVPGENLRGTMSHEQNSLGFGYGQLPTDRSETQRHEEISDHFVKALDVAQQAGQEVDQSSASENSKMEEAAAEMKSGAAGCLSTEDLDAGACFSAEVPDLSQPFPEQQNFQQDMSEEDVHSFFRLEVMQTENSCCYLSQSPQVNEYERLGYNPFMTPADLASGFVQSEMSACELSSSYSLGACDRVEDDLVDYANSGNDLFGL